MSMEKEKLLKAKEILRKMANGIDPLTGEQIGEGSFLHDPRMIRCLYFIEEVLNSAVDGQLKFASGKADVFVITHEEKSRVELPPGRIGVNEFARCVNRAIDFSKSRKLSGVELNRRLKKMGVLGEEALGDGKKRTVPGANALEHGIETEKRNYNGNEYEMILFNETGKKFLLDNLETIMAAGN